MRGKSAAEMPNIWLKPLLPNISHSNITCAACWTVRQIASRVTWLDAEVILGVDEVGQKEEVRYYRYVVGEAISNQALEVLVPALIEIQ